MRMSISEALMAVILATLVIIFLIFLVRIPIIIARNRGIYGGNLTTIAILSWLGLILGITWVIALVFAMIWRGEGGGADVDKLGKLHKLKKSGAITQKEFDAEKRKILD